MGGEKMGEERRTREGRKEEGRGGEGRKKEEKELKSNCKHEKGDQNSNVQKNLIFIKKNGEYTQRKIETRDHVV
jgi:hypothetical protein